MYEKGMIVIDETTIVVEAVVGRGSEETEGGRTRERRGEDIAA